MIQLDLFSPPPLAQDQIWAETLLRFRRQKQYFKQIQAAFSRYGTNLRQVARHVKDLINPFDPTNEFDMKTLDGLVKQYSDMLTPWATATATRFVNDIAQRDERAWYKTAKEIGVALRDEIKNTPIGATAMRILDDQVRMIKDIPEEAGRQMQQLSVDYSTGGLRRSDLAPRIKEIHGMTDNRAVLIARTEGAKAQSAITKARAEFLGSTHYYWRTARDFAVRSKHKALEGTIQSWAEPPEAEENGEHHHPGDFPNCRCYAEPIIPKG